MNLQYFCEEMERYMNQHLPKNDDSFVNYILQDILSFLDY